MTVEWQSIIDFSSYAGEALTAKICSTLKEIIEYDLDKNESVIIDSYKAIKSHLDTHPHPDMTIEELFAHCTATNRVKIYIYALRSYLSDMSQDKNSYIRVIASSDSRYSSYENFNGDYKVELVAGGSIIDYTTIVIHDIVHEILKEPLSKIVMQREQLEQMIEAQINIHKNT